MIILSFSLIFLAKTKTFRITTKKKQIVLFDRQRFDQGAKFLGGQRHRPNNAFPRSIIKGGLREGQGVTFARVSKKRVKQHNRTIIHRGL